MWYNYRTLRENAPATGQPRPTSPDPRNNALEGNRVTDTTTANGSNGGNGANGQSKRSKRAQQTLSAVGALVTLLKLTGG